MNSAILNKLIEARLHIKKSDLGKTGRNEYSKYDYYTPEQVELLVQQATYATNTIVLCNLKEDEFGLYQELLFVDTDKPENVLTFQLRTKFGTVTATNETQQMGSTDTYSERYIKMKVFGIKDNTLDPDSQDQRKSKEKMMTQDQRDWFTKSITLVPVDMAGKINHWLKSEHTFEVAEKFQKRINSVVDQNA